MNRTPHLALAALAAAVILIPCGAAAQEFDDERPPEEAPAPDIPVERSSEHPPDPVPPAEEEGHAPAPAADVQVDHEAPAEAQPPAADQAGTQAPAQPAAPPPIKRKKGEPQDAVIKVSLKVIYASKEQKSIDHRIKDLAKKFQKEFKEYELTKFVLLEAKEFKIEPRVTLPIDLPGDKRLNLTNGGVKDKKVVLALDVPDLIKTTVLVAPNGKFSFGGPKYKYGDGMVIVVLMAQPKGK